MPTDVSLHEAATVLHDVADAVDRAARQIVPPVDSADTLCDRYRGAAASWPTAPAPSYERLAGLLATLHEAGAAVRGAARKCEGADDAFRAALAGEGRTS